MLQRYMVMVDRLEARWLPILSLIRCARKASTSLTQISFRNFLPRSSTSSPMECVLLWYDRSLLTSSRLKYSFAHSLKRTGFASSIKTFPCMRFVLIVASISRATVLFKHPTFHRLSLAPGTPVASLRAFPSSETYSPVSLKGCSKPCPQCSQGLFSGRLSRFHSILLNPLLKRLLSESDNAAHFHAFNLPLVDPGVHGQFRKAKIGRCFIDGQ